MALVLCCGRDGLLTWRDGWQALPCPLTAPSLLSREGDRLSVLDQEHGLLWHSGQTAAVDMGAEQLLVWHGHPLVLSGDTDCLTLLEPSTAEPLVAVPVGVYPQDACLIPGDVVAVCGGAEGAVHLLHLPEMHLWRSIRVPGSAQRITWCRGWLYVLCAIGDEEIRCLLCRVQPRFPRCEPLHVMPGLPGAIHANDSGLWAAASEALYRFREGEARPVQTWMGFGLIRHIASARGVLLLSDPVLGEATLLEPGGKRSLLREGNVGEAAL